MLIPRMQMASTAWLKCFIENPSFFKTFNTGSPDGLGSTGFYGAYNADATVANDGDVRDADAHDPGDWVSSSDLSDPTFDGCETGPSSFHGTHVAGIIGAAINNSSKPSPLVSPAACWSHWP